MRNDERSSQLTATLIVFGLAVTSVVFWKSWINKRIKEKELDQTIELSRLEKEKMEIIQNAAQKFPAAEAVSESFGRVRDQLLTHLKPTDHLEIDPDSTNADSVEAPLRITGEQAGKITHTPREKAVEKVIAGEFFLKSADFADPKALGSKSNAFRTNTRLEPMFH